MLDAIKNSNFIRTVCDQLNRLPPTMVGLLTLLAYIIGAAGCGLLLVTAGVIIIYSLMFTVVLCLSLPFGIGMGILGMLIYFGLQGIIIVGKESNEGNKAPLTSLKLLFKQSAKLWCLAGILGYILFALFPTGRHLLVESRSFIFGRSPDEHALIGLQVFAIGWLALFVPKIPKAISLLMEFCTFIKSELALTGQRSLEKCVEIKTSANK